MKHSCFIGIIKKSVSLLLITLFAISPIQPCIHVKAHASVTASDDKTVGQYTVNTSGDGPYGYTMLSKETNGQSMQRLYESIDSSVSKYINGGGDIPTDSPWNSSGNVYYEIPSASFTGSDYGLSIDEMISVYFTYRSDHPEAFFLPPSYLFSDSSSTIFLIIPEDLALQSERVKYSKLAQNRLESFQSSLSASDSDYEIAIKAHDLLMKENFYRYDSGNIPSTKQSAHSIVGWLDGSGVVCEGYSKAFQYLLQGCEIDCLYVAGTSEGQAHAWNMVKSDSSWFWVDATFDDQSNLPGGYYHYYFGLSDSAFLSNHIPCDRTFGSSYQVELPDVPDDFNSFYYKKTGALISETDSAELMNTVANNAKYAFDNESYTVTLFAENESAKTQALQNLGKTSIMMQMLKDFDLSLRCSTKYSISTISAADAGKGGCIIYIHYNYHPCDVDRNTFVEKYDAELILDALCTNIQMPNYADTDENGTVTVYDAVFVLKTIK